jgi:hypothetical protein
VQTVTKQVPVSRLPRDADGKVRFMVSPGLEVSSIAYNGIGFTAELGWAYPFRPGPSSFYIENASLPDNDAIHSLDITFEGVPESLFEYDPGSMAPRPKRQEGSKIQELVLDCLLSTQEDRVAVEAALQQALSKHGSWRAKLILWSQVGHRLSPFARTIVIGIPVALLTLVLWLLGIS